MRFGMVGRTGPGMRQVVGFGDRSTRKGNLGWVEFGARHCNQCGPDVNFTERQNTVPKLLWADLFIKYRFE